MSKLLDVTQKKVSELKEETRPFLSRNRSPITKCLVSSAHRSIDLNSGTRGERAHNLPIVRA
jgi:hypothetical protein